jgi:predicted permease
VDALLQDLRQALRQVRLRPVFALVAALSLAIGVGANTAIFSAVSALLLRPVPGVAAPDRVVEVGRSTGGRGFDTFAYPDYEDLSAQVSAFQVSAAYEFGEFAMSRGGEGERITGMGVSPAYFDVMGVRASMGRFFTSEEDAPGAAPAVAVVDHRFWTEVLGGDPGVLGATIRVNRVPFTVVGVAPPDFHGHTVGFQPDVYLPIRAMPLVQDGRDEFANRRASWHMMVARLAPGSDLEDADAQVKGVYARLAEAYPESNRDRSGSVVPLGLVPGAGRAGVAAFLFVLLGMVGLVLVVTCANVAGMFIARAASREKEIAVRLALGSGRRRLVRQLLVESLVIFVLGGAVGGVVGAWLLGLVPIGRLPVSIPIRVDLAPDLRVLFFGLGLTLVTGLLFGLLPALQATRVDLTNSLRADGSGRAGAGRLRRVFVTGQVGFSLVLLMAGGLFLRSLQRAAAVDTGFDPSDGYLAEIDLGLEGYDRDRGLVFQRELLARLRALPGVRDAALSIDLPLDLGSHGTSAYAEGWSGPDGRESLGVDFNRVSAGYFETLSIPVLQGREFSSEDGAGSEPVVVVSRTFASTVWPGESVLGRRVRVSLPGIDEEWRAVVGVVGDVKNQILTETPEPFVYLPLEQTYDPGTYVVVKARGGMTQVAPALRRAVLEGDGSLSVTPVVSLGRYTGIGILPQRIAASITAVLGVLAVLLAGVGIYGVVAVAVSQRTREVGVRMALGAGRGRVLRLILGGGLRLALPGLILGGLASLVVGRLLSFLLLGLSPVDPVALIGVSCALLLVVLVASAVPARRAAAVHPAEALRSE